jgi:hypothetical protein
MAATLVGQGGPLWSRALRLLEHDFHHLPGYAALDAGWVGGVAAAVVVEAAGAVLLAPFVLRSCAQVHPDLAEYRDAVSPYGYGGVLVGPGTVEPEIKCDLLRTMARVLADAGVIAAFTRLHPALDLCAGILGRQGVAVVEHEPILVVDLRQSHQDWLSGLSDGHRRGVRKLMRAGFASRVDACGDLDTLVRLYADTIESVGAGPYYRFDRAYFEELGRVLGDGAHVCTIVAPDGTPAAAGLFVHSGSTVHDHLGGSDREFRTMAPTKLLVHEIVRWARDHGCHHVNLGGGAGTLRGFKQGFANAAYPLRSARFVLDEGAYVQACRMACGEAWRRCDTRFFPEYRQSPSVGADRR